MLSNPYDGYQSGIWSYISYKTTKKNFTNKELDIFCI